MARACLANYNGRGQALLAKLKSEGRIIDYYNVVGTPRWCFEFSNTLRISFDDYLEVAPKYMQRGDTHIELLREEFKDAIVLPIVNSITGGEVKEFSDTNIVLEDTSRTAMVCVRFTRREKTLLEEEAENEGKTVSELIRERVLSNTRS